MKMGDRGERLALVVLTNEGDDSWEYCTNEDGSEIAGNGTIEELLESADLERYKGQKLFILKERREVLTEIST